VARDFAASGATHIHLVDLEGAKAGTTPNFNTVAAIKSETGLFCEIGGGIRSMETIDRYLSAGIDRVILGTAAVTEPGFVEKAVSAYGDKIAVGIDIKDGYVAIKGWTEKSEETAFDFTEKMQKIGVKTMICTDISKDGAMQGANHDLYRQLSERFDMDIIASGGVSSMVDVEKLSALNIHGAIVGKAYYTGAIDLKKAIEVAK
jgi:phosphoribosylformimino-5-aminoimidazole carboxamide ribotide isomerase